jgi:DNA-binding NarL/FixJ family response regulator
LGAIRVLWIDDDAGFVRPLAAFLSRSGCDVTRLATGRSAIAALGCGSFDVIVIEWQLSDIPGRDLLERFAGADVTVPVLVLSRYVDLESAREAGRLGACRVRRKPIGCVDLLVDIKACAATHTPPPSAEWSWTARARDLLLGAAADLAASPGRAAGDGADTLRQLGSLLTERDASIPEIASGTKAFKYLRFSAGHGVASAMEACRILDAAVFDSRSLDPVIVDVVAEFECNTSVTRLSEAGTARRLGVSSSHLGRLLCRQTHLDWRSWSVAARFRSVLRDLGSTGAPLKTIAFAHGWRSYEQFCRSVRYQLGVSPGEFRNVVRFRDRDAQVDVSVLQASII